MPSKGIEASCFLTEESNQLIMEIGHKEDEHHHDKDPHVWLDPTLAMKQAEKITNALGRVTTEHKQDSKKTCSTVHN